MFALYLRKVSLIKYIRYENIQMECGEPFYKKVACIWYYFYFATLWLGPSYNFGMLLDELFESRDIIIAKNNFEYVLGNSKNSD